MNTELKEKHLMQTSEIYAEIGRYIVQFEQVCHSLQWEHN
jgi:hypothetical protein